MESSLIPYLKEGVFSATMDKNQHWGSTLDDFLHEEGIYGAAKAKAVKLEQLGKIFAMDLTAVTLRHGTPKK